MNAIRRWFARRRVRALRSQAINMQELAAAYAVTLRSGVLPEGTDLVEAQGVLRFAYTMARTLVERMEAAEKRL